MLIATVLANDPNLIEENEVIEIPIEVEEIADVEQDEAQDRFVDLSVDVSYGLPQLGKEYCFILVSISFEYFRIHFEYI